MLSQTHYDIKPKNETSEFHYEQRGAQEGEYLLVLHAVAGERQVFNLQDSGFVLIGRHRENTIRLTDPQCSRLHCELTRASDQAWILHDLNSKNGTFVNERRLTGKHLLADGDVIQVGDVELIFVSIPPTQI